MKRLLFVGHEASRTGAPVLLLNFLRWLKAHHPEIELDVVLLDGGPLVPEYKELSDTLTVWAIKSSGFSHFISRVRRKLKISLVADLRPYLRPDRQYDLVVGNTVLSLPALCLLARSGMKTVCWVHEMRVLTDEFFRRGQFVRMIRQMDRVIAGSYAVKHDLRGQGQNFPVEVVYELQPHSELLDGMKFRAEFGIPKNAFVVGGCGTVSWRKGTDIFLRAAHVLHSRYDDVYFIWAGPEQLLRDRRLDREMWSVGSTAHNDRIIFTGELQSVAPFFAAIDVFALTSREDPFPLVCLLAADQAKPVVCFADGGGIPEFVGTDAGKVVPFGDVQKLVAAIEEYYFDRESAARDGMEARKKRSGEFSLESSCSRLFEILNQI